MCIFLCNLKSTPSLRTLRPSQKVPEDFLASVKTISRSSQTTCNRLFVLRLDGNHPRNAILCSLQLDAKYGTHRTCWAFFLASKQNTNTVRVALI